MDEQLTSIEQRLWTYESYFENFTIDNKTNDLPSAIGEAIAQLKELELRKLSLRQTQEAVAGLSEQVKNEELVYTGPTAFTDYPEDLSTYVEQLNQLLNERTLLMQSYKETSHALKLKDQKVELLKKDITQLLAAYRNQLAEAIQRWTVAGPRWSRSSFSYPPKVRSTTRTSATSTFTNRCTCR